jgi:hypothetical protein
VATPVGCWAAVSGHGLRVSRSADRYVLLHLLQAFCVERLGELIEPGRTRLLVVNVPHNPTGWLPTPREWSELIHLCDRHGAASIMRRPDPPPQLAWHGRQLPHPRHSLPTARLHAGRDSYHRGAGDWSRSAVCLGWVVKLSWFLSAAAGLWLFSDEMYRHLERERLQTTHPTLPTAAAAYPGRGVTLGGACARCWRCTHTRMPHALPHPPTRPRPPPQRRRWAEIRSDTTHLAGGELLMGVLPIVPIVPVAGLSKAWGLAGLRAGWLACSEPSVLRRAAELKDYTSICAGTPNECLALMALRARERCWCVVP